MTADAAISSTPAAAADQPPAVAADWALRVEDLALNVPVDGPPAAWRPVVRGLTVRLTDEALRAGIADATTIADRLSRTKAEEFLDQLSASPWLRSFRWYYASLLRLAAVENGLDIDGELAPGAVVARARFRPAPERGFFGQIRDMAKGAVTITARIQLSVGDNGRLRLRLELDPDVRGLAAKALLGAVAKRPGIHRIDDVTVEVDLGILIAQETTAPVDWEAVVQSVDVTPEVMTVVLGPRSDGDA